MTLNRTPLVTAVAAAALAVLTACESSTVMSPNSPGAVSFARSTGNANCTISLPAALVRPLPAVREVARELNEAFGKPQASISCGAVNGIAQRFNTLVSMLDRSFEDQNLDAACGIATGLSNELEQLAANGQFNPSVTHPPEASGNVVENMQFITSMFCANAGHP